MRLPCTQVNHVLLDFSKFELSMLFLLFDKPNDTWGWIVDSDVYQFTLNGDFQWWVLLAKTILDELEADQTLIDDLPNQVEVWKISESIRTIRKFAKNFSYNEWPLEYYIALFAWSLRATYWYDSPPAKRLLAYFFSCMLAERISRFV